MIIEITDIKYHRGEEKISISEGQALLLVSDLVTAAMAQSGFSGVVRVKD